jgi:hypothetical protein
VVYFGGFFVKLGYFAGFPIVTLKRSSIYVKIGEVKKIVSQKEIKGHKNTNAPLILKIWDIIFLVLGKLHFEGASTFLTPIGVKKVLAPSKYPLKWPIM